MVIPRDAFESNAEMEDFLAGRPLPKKQRVGKPEPEPPVVPDQLHFGDIPEGAVVDIEARGRSLKKAVRNKDGMIFVGHDVSVVIGEQTFSGWMAESDCFLLKKRIPLERTDLFQKISF